MYPKGVTLGLESFKKNQNGSRISNNTLLCIKVETVEKTSIKQHLLLEFNPLFYYYCTPTNGSKVNGEK